MRIRLEKRLTPSRFMQVATPIASVLLTMLLGAIIFELIGFDGPHAIYETFITPIVAPYKWDDVLTKAAPLIIIALGLVARQSGQDLEHRRRRPVHHRRARRRGRRLRAAQRRGFWIIPLMIAAGIVGGMAWAAIPACLKTRFRVSEVLSTPDAGLCRAAGAELSDRRPVEGSERPQFPPDPAADRGAATAPCPARNARFRPASSSPSC